ncbi:hypothetical protein N9C70_04970 [Flavobacteriales bacterium]|jgi:hypothetical protein|nr:hypothetical protein [Flavobacteriales bacterium]MDA9864404.1 hypothetical protein [Flavobacteriales bacterium]
MNRLCLLVTAILLCYTNHLSAQTVDGAGTGVEICDCLPADSYLLLKKTKFTFGNTQVQYTSNIEVLISFLGAYGHVGPHAMNLSWPNDLAVGSADLTNVLSGFNYYPSFESTLCNWEVMNVASHGWILEEIGASGYSEAYIHESTYDEFDLGNETYGQCLLNSFDLEMVYLPDSVVRLSFVRKFLGNPVPD